MQSASVNYINASSAAGGVWATPKLQADWMLDGYDVTANLMDGYNRSISTGWGLTETLQTWLSVGGSASDYFTAYDGSDALIGGYGAHSVSNPTGTYQTRGSVLDGPLVFVTRQITKLQMPVPTGDAIESLSYYRFIDASNHYRAGVVVQVGGGVTIAIVRAVGGVDTVLANNIDIGLTYAGGTQVLVSEDRMLADGTLQARAYIDGTAVPDWQVTVQDTDQILTSGVPGLRTTIYPANTNVRPVIVKYVSYQVVNGLPDDISGQLGGWSVTHHLDDGYPDSVTFISGVGTPALSAGLGPPSPFYTDGVPVTAREYYSPYNTRSPIWGRDRDISPVKLEAGLVTSAGQERLSVFTGQMSDIPVKGGQATLQAVSATRLKLSRLVQPPAINGAYQGANALFPVSYALAACGVYSSPPPQTGCRYWAPQHGAPRAFLPDGNFSAIDILIFTYGGSGPQRKLPVRFCSGPFSGAVEYGVSTEYFQTANAGSTGVALEPGPALACTTSVGKWEFWVRGDAWDANAAIAWGQAAPTSIMRTIITNTNGSLIDCFIRSDTRQLQITLNDSVNTNTATTTVVPTDGEWHFVGFAWDITNKRYWTNMDGTVVTNTFASLVPANYPATESLAADQPRVFYRLPAAEVQLTAGVTGGSANPTIGGWLKDIAFTPGAVVSPSTLDLVHVVERQPVEAWELVSRYAQAELASMRTDENDVFNYLTPGWWVKDAQQVVAEVYSTEFNADTVDINIDPTKIRNQVIVSFDEVLSLGDSYQTVYSSTEVVRVPTGTSTFVVPFSGSAYEIRGFTFTNIVAATVTQPSNVNSVSFNAATDGSSTYYDALQCSATVIDWNPGSATIQFVNTIASDVFLANNKSWPSMTVAAKAVDSASANVLESDASSVAVRGERSLSVTASVLQTRLNARRLARRLVANLRFPQPAAEELNLFGEARRQPGDYVTFLDPSMTRVSGMWRVQSVKHDQTASDGEVSYTNQVIVRPTRDIMIIGEGLVGYSLIGPEE